MVNDPIVEETRKLRDAYAAKFDYDLDAIARDLKQWRASVAGNLEHAPPPKKNLPQQSGWPAA